MLQKYKNANDFFSKCNALNRIIVLYAALQEICDQEELRSTQKISKVSLLVEKGE